MGMMKFALAAGLLLLAACASTTRPDASATPSAGPDVVARPVPAVRTEATAPVEPARSMPAIPAEEVPAAEPTAAPVAATPASSSTPSVKPPVELVVQRRAPPAKPPVPPKTKPPAGAAQPSETAPAAVNENRIRGRLELVAGSGQSLDASEMRNAAVYFIPNSTPVSAKPGRFRIYTHDKSFDPESMVIPLGSTISFPNQDEILHNVFSVTPKSSFDLGVYGEGKTAEYTFRQPGLVLINCNVHHAMQANVLVVDTPFIASPDKDGNFELKGLPAGSGKLMAWHPRGVVQAVSVSVPGSTPAALRLTLTKPRIVEHLNKERKPYQ